MRWLVAISIGLFAQSACAETVFVKYRGMVDLAAFSCDAINRSNFIQRVCYDKGNEYMLINLHGTWYHYCEIPARILAALYAAQSMGSYYNSDIKGQYDCRVHRVPEYR